MSELYRLLNLSLNIGQLFLPTGSTDQLLAKYCKTITDSGQFNTVWLGLLSDDQTHLKTIQYDQQCEPACIKETLPAFVLNNSLQSLGMAGRCILENQLFILNNVHDAILSECVSTFKPWQQYYKTTEIQSAIVLPLSPQPSSKPVGCMMLTSNRVNAFNDDIILILKEVSLNISQAIVFKNKVLDKKRSEMLFQQERVLLRENAKKFRALLDGMPNIAIQGYDKNRKIIYWNQASEMLYGYSVEEALGKKLEELIIPDEIKTDTIEAIRQWSENGIAIPSSELMLKNKSGGDVPVYSSHVRLKDSAGDAEFFCIDIDLTVQKSNQEKLEKMANFDQLTQLPNRNLFLERFEQSLNEARRFEKTIAVIFMDLDNFKYINDTFGHEIGDVLLIQVARRLSQSLRKYDLISRFGGDEFVIALPHLDKEQLIAPLVKKLKSAFNEPFELSGQSSYVTCSMGVSSYPDSGDNVSSLIKCADMAMYKAKEKGRNQFHFFNERINHKVERQTRLSSELGNALENNEFSLLYQPQIELSSGKIVACEALLRWDNKILGDISPLEFIPVAEQSNLINKIDLWVLEQIKCDLQDWLASGKQPVRVFANFSERGFSDNLFLTKLKQFIHNHLFITRYLGIELAEPVLLKTSEQTNKLLSFLHENGISLTLDNFGHGCSSVNLLKNSLIDRIKIGKEFIDKAALDGHEEPFINAIIAMSQALNIRIVAVGIQQPEQKLYIEQTQCEIVQGFIYHKPMSADALKKILEVSLE